MSLNTGENFSDYIRKEIKVTEETAEIAQFGLEVFTSTLLGLVTILIFGAIFGVVPQALAAVIGVASVRVFAGGAHCSTAVRCALVSGLVFPILGLLANGQAAFIQPHLELFLGVVVTVGLVSVFTLAPVDSPEKPILTDTHRRRLRRLSVIAVVVLVVLIYAVSRLVPAAGTLAVAASFGLVWQCFVLTNCAHKLMAIIEKGFDWITCKRR